MYRRYLYCFFAGFALVCAFGVALFVGQLGVPTPTTQTIADMISLKENQASAATGRRILFVGGSNVLYGIQAERVEAAFGIPSVNLGVNAGLGCTYILHRVERLLRPGDIVVLVFEYSHYAYDGSLDRMHADFVLSRDPDYFWQAPLRLKWAYGKAFTLLGLMERNLARFTFDAGRRSERSMSLNPYGDETKNRLQDQDPARKTRVERATAYNLSQFPDDTPGLQAIEAFVASARKKNALVLASFPSLMNFPQYAEPSVQAYFASVTAFYETLGVPLLGTPGDFLYPREQFFDMAYHLMHGPAAARTQQLIDLLRREEENRAGFFTVGYSLETKKQIDE